MRTRDVVIFFSGFLLLYGLINFYILSHGWAALGSYPHLRFLYVGLYLAIALAWITGRLLERWRITVVSSALIWSGSFWLAAMVYFFVLVLLIDIVRLANALAPFLSRNVFEPEILFRIMIASVALVASVILAGALNARIPRIRQLNLVVDKYAGDLKSLNVVAVSDIHLGTIICKSRIERIVKRVNSLNPDIVLLPGDVVDEDIGPVIRQNLGETLRTIRSKFGVFAVTGNHEYIGGVEPACAYLSEHGITMLRDATVKIAGCFYIVGREDVSYNRGTLRRRKPLKELLHDIDASLPVISMDHQPFRLGEAEEAGIDLQLSGHTHHGQLWPFNFVTKRIFEVSWGYKRKGNTHIYVSCGAGSWGPPVRIGNTPEIVNINLIFR